MGNLRERTLFGILLATGSVLVASGIALGSVSGSLALGEDNRVGLGSTTLTTATPSDALSIRQNGTGAAVRGSTNGPGIAGAFTSKAGTGVAAVVGAEDSFALYAGNEGPAPGAGGAIRADGKQSLGIAATSQGASAIRARGRGGSELEDCARLACAGLAATGAIGVVGTTGSAGGVGVYAADQTPAHDGLAMVAAGDAVISGSLFVESGCIGCAQLAIAYNVSSQVLRQGDAVTLVGLDVTQDGVTVLVVAPAARGNAVIGVVDRVVTRLAPPPGTEEAGQKWLLGKATVPPESALRIVTGGIITMEGALGGVSAGDRLAVGDTPGRLVTSIEGEVTVGRYLGPRPDGGGVLMVDLD